MTAQVLGVGAVASVGDGADDVFEALCAGRSGRAELRGFDVSGFRVRHAYEIDDRRVPGRDEPGRATRWLLRAIEEALRDAGIGTQSPDTPVVVGTGLRELRSAELHWVNETQCTVDDLDFGRALHERFGTVSCSTFANACSASLYALALGADLLALGRADTVVVAGVDAVTVSMFGLLDRVHAVPPETVRPFDRDRKGVLMGDGAAAVVLGNAPAADGAGALGTIRSVALNCDAYHVTAPDPNGIAAAIRQAHTRASVTPADIDLVMLHGTGTLRNDEAEAVAMREVFGPFATRPAMTAIKSLTGHTSGASGLLGVVVALRALARGLVPPTAGLSDVVAEAAGFRFVTGQASNERCRLAQINAFGFGGLNAVAIVAGASS